MTYRTAITRPELVCISLSNLTSFHSVLQASYYSDPVALYSYVHSKGVGNRTAALYVAWAKQFEQRGMNEQAEAVYQKAVQNQAQPTDVVLSEYR